MKDLCLGYSIIGIIPTMLFAIAGLELLMVTAIVLQAIALAIGIILEG